MNIKQMAALRVAGIVGSAVGTAVVVNVMIHYLGLATVGVIAAVALLVYFAKFAYDIELDKLERLNSLKRIKDAE